MSGIIRGCRRIGMWVVGRTFVRVRKVAPYPAERLLGERRLERIVFTTYNWGYASQLEILEVVHLALELFLRFGIFGIRVLPFSSMASPTLPLNIIMHFPRERVYLVTVGAGKIKNQISTESKGDSLESRHQFRISYSWMFR